MLPARARRLFPDYDDCDRVTRANRGLVLARILEHGDSEDLAWLMGAVLEGELTAWFESHGRRQLSRRSAAFWRHLLTPDLETPTLQENPLWPL